MKDPLVDVGLATTEALDLRKKYRGYRPFALAKLRGQVELLEFISWPFQSEAEGNRVYIMARAIEDPTTIKRYQCRKQISPVSWSHLRQRAYREGFQAGYAHAVTISKELTQVRIADAVSRIHAAKSAQEPPGRS